MIDWTRIHELRDEIGMDDFQEVVDLFLSEVDETLSGLAALRNDAQMLQERLHFLKGSALNLGFSEMSHLCHAGERACAAGHHDSVDVGQVVDVFSTSRSVFLRELPVQMAAA